MTTYVAYIRVSDRKQRDGVSLDQQRADIERYAARQSLSIMDWFVDVETAAKTGRREFTKMLRALRSKRSTGVIFHKIDRSMRNRTEWAKLNELFDRGVDVRFAHEGVDMHTRSGRVAADVQAALAVAYIANLRDEVYKGMWGRLKEGLYPWTAPPGYRNNGPGKLKTIDPVQGPLARDVFERYAEGGFTLRTLAEEMKRRGLRHLYKDREATVTKNGIAAMLRNPFYIGLIEVKTTGETFEGAHEPLISRALYDRVQQALDGRVHRKVQRHNFVFRRLVTCASCGYKLIGERQKHHTYYRCHRTACRTSLREEVVEEAVTQALRSLWFSDEETAYLGKRIKAMRADLLEARENTRMSHELELEKTKKRLLALTDALLDGLVEKELFEERKRELLMRRGELEEQLEDMTREAATQSQTLQRYLELARSALQSYEEGSVDEKRQLLMEVTSNLEARGKEVSVELDYPYSLIAKR